MHGRLYNVYIHIHYQMINFFDITCLILFVLHFSFTGTKEIVIQGLERSKVHINNIKYINTFKENDIVFF